MLKNKDSSVIIYGIGAIIASTLLGWSSRSIWGLAIIEIIILSVFLISITQIGKEKFHLPLSLKLFICALIISTVFSVYYYNSILKLVMYLLFIVAFWLVVRFIKNTAQHKTIVLIITVVALISAINGIVNFFELQDISLGVSSFFGWRNIFAGFILLVLPITITQFLVENGRKEKILFGTTTVLLAVNLYLTFSQASWITMVFVLAILIWLVRKLPIKQLVIRLSVITVISTILIVGLLQIHSAPIGESIQQASSIQSNAVNNRIDYWKTSFEMFTHYPLTGVGIGNFETIYPHYQQNVWSFSVSPHNNLLLFLTELGLFGLIAFIVFMIMIAHQAKKALDLNGNNKSGTYYYAVGLFGGIIGSFGHSLVDVDWEIPSLFLLWFIEVGLIFSIAKKTPADSPDNLQNINGNRKFQTPALVLIIAFGYLIFIPTITDLWNKQADLIQDDMGDINDAISLLNKAVILNPINADLHANLSESYQISILDKKGNRTENQAKSLIHAKKSALLDSQSAKRHEALGYALNFVSSGEDVEIVQAESEVQIAIKYNPNVMYPYQLLGFIYQRQNKFDEAIAILDDAIQKFDADSINKIHADLETHNQLVAQLESIGNLKNNINIQQDIE